VNDAGKSVEAPSQIDRLEADEHLDTMRDHVGCPGAPSIAKTVCSASCPSSPPIQIHNPSCPFSPPPQIHNQSLPAHNLSRRVVRGLDRDRPDNTGNDMVGDVCTPRLDCPTANATCFDLHAARR
jgi:hypothetical protein